jgi:predicted amidohydrolase YtcJ
MKLAGISKATKDVAGGTIVRDKDGNPTGIFKDNAMALISNVIPPPDEEAEMKAVEAAMKYVASKGVTSVHHMDGNIGLDIALVINRFAARAVIEGRVRAIDPGEPAENRHVEIEAPEQQGPVRLVQLLNPLRVDIEQAFLLIVGRNGHIVPVTARIRYFCHTQP